MAARRPVVPSRPTAAGDFAGGCGVVIAAHDTLVGLVNVTTHAGVPGPSVRLQLLHRRDFDLTSPGTTPPTIRTYHRFTDVVHDTIIGRVHTGFHFRNADAQGAWIGKKVAQWVDKHHFAPVD